MHIRLLDDETINKIAAGEVVEGPYSVVKELVENSIDAGATIITVEIKEGGISLIRITDNGCGIDREDIELAFTSHATSKIEEAEDLFKISSLGFRGEALASVAAVSKIELITKTPDSLAGVRAVYEGGKCILIEDIGAPVGTTIIVRDLFFNTPARRNFLKSASAEGAKVGTLVEELSFSHPETAFRYISEGRNKFSTSGNDNIKENIYSVYGRDVSSNLIEINASNDIIKAYGFIGKPSISRGSRASMIYFINNRFIKNELVRTAIEAAYSNFLMQHKYPFTMLYFKVDPEIIDVNVHPRKLELKFRTDVDIWKFVYDIVYEALSREDLVRRDAEIEVETIVETKSETKADNNSYVATPKAVSVKDEPIRPAEIFEPKRSSFIYSNIQVDKNDIPDSMIEKQLSFFKRENAVSEVKPAKTVKPVETEETVETPMIERDEFEDLQIVGQVFGTYWIVEYKDSMYMIDQHAAHEKVYYERFVKRYIDGETFSQQIFPAIIVSLNPSEKHALLENMDIFTKIGFEIENFGGNEYSIRALPMEVCNVDCEEYFMELIDKLVEREGRISKDEIYKPICENIATMACKAAIKGNDKITAEEFKALVKEMFKLDNPYNCPHGRPTTIAMSKYEIEKKFKRII